LAAAAFTAVLSATYVVWVARRDPTYVSDFDQLWVSARALMAGENPYQAVRSGFAGHGPLGFPLFYPLPAVVAAVPFALLHLVAARATFAALSMATFSYLLAGRGLFALTALLSAPAFLTVSLVQWSGWLACAAMVPWLGWALVCKPNAGLPVLTSAPSTRAFAVSLVLSGLLVMVAFALQPGWVADWRAALQGQPHFKPYLLRPGGFLLLLALLRWRRPEARWLAVLACVPATPGPQEALVFFSWDLSFRQLLVLGLLSHGAMWAAVPARQHGDFYSYVDVAALANLALIYVPMLVIILRRPNEGPVPAALDRLIARIAARFRRK
jgi:hypothetical protein